MRGRGHFAMLSGEERVSSRGKMGYQSRDTMMEAPNDAQFARRPPVPDRARSACRILVIERNGQGGMRRRFKEVEREAGCGARRHQQYGCAGQEGAKAYGCRRRLRQVSRAKRD